jgi:mRNA-degrading endonuclease RelE of RelBE toxin-antitoxin system
MRLETTRTFDRDYAHLPHQIRKRADKQLKLLLSNPRHPSLQIEKMERHRDIWKGRITQNYRFTFYIVGDTYFLRRIGSHDILKRP